MQNQNQPIAKEGYPFIGLFGFVTLVFALLGWSFFALNMLALTLFSVYFFRNPERSIHIGGDSIATGLSERRASGFDDVG